MSTTAIEHQFRASIKIRLPSVKAAEIVMKTLAVDEELQPEKISKHFNTVDNVLIVTFISSELKVLRVAISSITDMAIVSLKTLMEFDE